MPPPPPRSPREPTPPPHPSTSPFYSPLALRPDLPRAQIAAWVGGQQAPASAGPGGRDREVEGFPGGFVFGARGRGEVAGHGFGSRGVWVGGGGVGGRGFGVLGCRWRRRGGPGRKWGGGGCGLYWVCGGGGIGGMCGRVGVGACGGSLLCWLKSSR